MPPPSHHHHVLTHGHCHSHCLFYLQASTSASPSTATFARMHGATQSAKKTWWRIMLLVLLYAPGVWFAEGLGRPSGVPTEDSGGCTTPLHQPLTVAVWESGDKQAIKNCTCIPDYAFTEYNSATDFVLSDISNIRSVGVQAFAGFHGTLIFGSQQGKGAPQLIVVRVSCLILPVCRASMYACISSCRKRSARRRASPGTQSARCGPFCVPADRMSSLILFSSVCYSFIQHLLKRAHTHAPTHTGKCVPNDRHACATKFRNQSAHPLQLAVDRSGRVFFMERRIQCYECCRSAGRYWLFRVRPQPEPLSQLHFAAYIGSLGSAKRSNCGNGHHLSREFEVVRLATTIW